MSSPIVELSTLEQTDQLEYESDVEADLEVDQLDSDTDAETEANASKKKSPSGERISGSSLLPAMRLENIIQAEGMSVVWQTILPQRLPRSHWKPCVIKGRPLCSFNRHGMFFSLPSLSSIYHENPRRSLSNALCKLGIFRPVRNAGTWSVIVIWVCSFSASSLLPSFSRVQLSQLNNIKSSCFFVVCLSLHGIFSSSPSMTQIPFLLPLLSKMLCYCARQRRESSSRKIQPWQPPFQYPPQLLHQMPDQPYRTSQTPQQTSKARVLLRMEKKSRSTGMLMKALVTDMNLRGRDRALMSTLALSPLTSPEPPDQRFLCQM